MPCEYKRKIKKSKHPVNVSKNKRWKATKEVKGDVHPAVGAKY